MRARGRELRERFGGGAPRAGSRGSTRDGEEALLLDAFARAAARRDDAARSSCRAIRSASTRSPRCCARAGSRSCGAAHGAPVAAGTRVVLGDSMGEMLAYYAAADVAFVGGSLLPLGGQNLIEPIARRRAGARRTAHVQLRGGDRAGDRGRRGAPRCRCGCARRARRRRCSPTMPPATRMRQAALAFHAAHRGAPTGCGRGWRRGLHPRVQRAAS